MKTPAARTSAPVGRPIRAEAFRKQVSRVRCLFAEFLVKEVARVLDHPTTEQVKEELAELALWGYIRDFLPAHQRRERSEPTQPAPLAVPSLAVSGEFPSWTQNLGSLRSECS
jgi:hypothetical protein